MRLSVSLSPLSLSLSTTRRRNACRCLCACRRCVCKHKGPARRRNNHLGRLSAGSLHGGQRPAAGVQFQTQECPKEHEPSTAPPISQEEPVEEPTQVCFSVPDRALATGTEYARGGSMGSSDFFFFTGLVIMAIIFHLCTYG